MSERQMRAIYWNESAGGWYDLATDVRVENMSAPEQSTSIDNVISAAGAAMSERQMREIAAQTIRDWSISVMDVFYFVPDGNRLPTYDMVQWLIGLQQERIAALEQRIARLERPW